MHDDGMVASVFSEVFLKLSIAFMAMPDGKSEEFPLLSPASRSLPAPHVATGGVWSYVDRSDVIHSGVIGRN